MVNLLTYPLCENTTQEMGKDKKVKEQGFAPKIGF
jgi:hypothetical protein